MKHSLKKIAVIVGSSICAFQMVNISVMAEVPENTSYRWENFASEEETSVEDTATPRARGDILNCGHVKLSNLDGNAGIYGETLCNFTLDEVGLEIYLEKYDGTVFNSYKDWSYVTYNTYHNTKALTTTVDKGFYYRLQGYHYAIDDELFETANTMTNGLPIK